MYEARLFCYHRHLFLPPAAEVFIYISQSTQVLFGYRILYNFFHLIVERNIRVLTLEISIEHHKLMVYPVDLFSFI